MSDLTIIIPVGPMHLHVVHDAIQSVMQQTRPCDLIVEEDTRGNGAGWARNRGLERVSTPYVSFLDADDVIDPHFAQVTLGILEQYAQSHDDTRYAYTDWMAQGEVRHAPDPCEAWTNKTFHLVNAVVPTAAARRIGGFDEVMTGVEDADFYVRLRLSKVCGIHINAPLVTYREGGQRSVNARLSGDESRALSYMTQRYGGYDMGCCGDNAQGPVGPTTEPQPGDILAQVLWGGNRQERGRATGRIYPRSASPKMMYVAASDVDASPHLWQRVQAPVQASNGVILQPQYKPDRPWTEVADAIFGGGQPKPQPVEIQYKPPVSGRKKADVLAKAQDE